MLREFQTNRSHFQSSTGASVFMENSASVPKNLTVIVTGASAGIGRIICQRLAAKKYHLVLAARSADKLAQLQAELSATGC
ncbi:MAG: SDR family NAD(P)-dependent oxidoreductase, partial [Planctomycetaceae bacterium]|nr:SDR family NAD(P)-dependent oxidoreductase [Planctomycetaceae bacterium]